MTAKTSTPSEKVTTIRRVFGLHSRPRRISIIKSARVPGGGITYITGFSGSGKSTLLRLISETLNGKPRSQRVKNIDIPIVDLIGWDVTDSIRWLAQFGLGEARVMTNTYRHLSDGQKERLRLALLLKDKPKYVVIDEFLAVLDRLTAKIVAFNLQKILRTHHITAYLASSHDDLIEPLGADHVIQLDSDGSSETFVPDCAGRPRLAETDEIKICDGSPNDYSKLARYHYVDEDAPIDWDNSILQIRTARFRGEVIAIMLCATPLTRLFNKIPFFRLLNQSVIVRTRTIVHPAFRGIGLTKILQPTLTPECRCILAFSAMGMYYPYHLGAGYDLSDHPRNIRLPEHSQLERFVTHNNSTVEELNDYKQAQLFYDSLDPKRRDKLRRIVTKIIVRNNLDYTVFLARLCKIEVDPQEQVPALRDFFQRLLETVEENNFGPFIGEAFYFPVQAFVKYVHNHSPAIMRNTENVCAGSIT